MINKIKCWLGFCDYRHVKIWPVFVLDLSKPAWASIVIKKAIFCIRCDKMKPFSDGFSDEKK